MLVEVVEQGMDGVARRAVLVVMQDPAVARIFLDQFAGREVMLEIDDHGAPACKGKKLHAFPSYANQGCGSSPKAA
jgi:hypothetical protein